MFLYSLHLSSPNRNKFLMPEQVLRNFSTALPTSTSGSLPFLSSVLLLFPVSFLFPATFVSSLMTILSFLSSYLSISALFFYISIAFPLSFPFWALVSFTAPSLSSDLSF